MTSAKMFVTKSPALPSRCVVCYTQAKGNQDFIDFGESIDYYGAITICDLCIVNASKLVGFVPVAEVEKAQAELVPLSAEVINLRLKVQSLESLVASYVGDPTFSIDSLLESLADVPIEFALADGFDESSASATSNQS